MTSPMIPSLSATPVSQPSLSQPSLFQPSAPDNHGPDNHGPDLPTPKPAGPGGGNSAGITVDPTIAEFPDIPGNTGTGAVIGIGDTVTGTIDPEGEQDWYLISLTAGQQIEIELDGTTLSDPYLRIFDATGSLLAENDDENYPSVLDSLLTFTAPATGDYYISAGAFSTERGEYQLSVETYTPAAYDPLASINWGNVLNDTTLQVYFCQPGESLTGQASETSEGFTQYEMDQFTAAFGLIEAVTNVSITVTTNRAQADWEVVLDTNEMAGNLLGYFYLPSSSGNPGPGGVFNGAAWDRAPGGRLEQGGTGFQTVVHELLHGMGLAHPHDNGGSSTIMEGVTSPFNDYGQDGLNQGIFTTMSYNEGYSTGTGSESASTNYGAEAGPMALDIALLQSLYGANMATATGNDSYSLTDVNGLGTLWRSIWDAGGTDTISYAGSADARVDLRAATLQGAVGGGGYLSHVAGIAGGYTIAAGVVIEQALTGAGDDTVTGNDVGNFIETGAGGDSITAADGNDWVDAGAGDDTLLGGMGDDDLLGRGGDDSILGGAGHDHMVGADGNDTLEGGTGNDTFGGGQGNDVFIGGEGHDYGGGGDGNDSIDAGAGNDLFSAGWGNDTIDGGEGDNWLAGSYDADEITSGSGNDTIGGGTGDDTISSGGGHDNIGAGDGNDDVTAGAGNDFLGGGDGNDTLNGGDGNDTLNGGWGDDQLTGGANADVFMFNAYLAGGDDTVTDFQTGIDLLRLVGVPLGADPFAALTLTDTAGGAEIDYGPHTVTLTGITVAMLDANDFLFT